MLQRTAFIPSRNFINVIYPVMPATEQKWPHSTMSTQFLKNCLLWHKLPRIPAYLQLSLSDSEFLLFSNVKGGLLPVEISMWKRSRWQEKCMDRIMSVLTTAYFKGLHFFSWVGVGLYKI